MVTEMTISQTIKSYNTGYSSLDLVYLHSACMYQLIQHMVSMYFQSEWSCVCVCVGGENVLPLVNTVFPYPRSSTVAERECSVLSECIPVCLCVRFFMHR